MEIWQIGCLGAFILFIGLLILGKKAQEIEKKIIAGLKSDGWQIIENSKDNVDVKEWVKTELQSDPDRYTVFGPLIEIYIGRSISRDSLSFNQLWNKQEGDKHYFILDVSDKYREPRVRVSGDSYSSVNFTIFGMRARQLSLPFFTLFPRMRFPKKRGWRHSISETHGLNLSDRINESAKEFNEDSAKDYRVKQPLVLLSILPDEPPPKIDPPMTFDSGPFNERYELYGQETERLSQFFDDEKLTALGSLPQTFVDAGGELVFIYIPEHKPNMVDIEKYINDSIAMINAVSREPDRVA